MVEPPPATGAERAQSSTVPVDAMASTSSSRLVAEQGQGFVDGVGSGCVPVALVGVGDRRVQRRASSVVDPAQLVAEQPPGAGDVAHDVEGATPVGPEARRQLVGSSSIGHRRAARPGSGAGSEASATSASSGVSRETSRPGIGQAGVPARAAAPALAAA